MGSDYDIVISPAKVWKNVVGEYHRLDGPAVVWENGNLDWWINDNLVTYKITKWAKERDIDLNNLTDEDKMIIMIEWGNYGK